MKQQLIVPKGSDIVSVWAKEHTYVRLVDSKGEETFRFQSPGEHITAAVKPGEYTIDTDGKLSKVELASLNSKMKSSFKGDSTKPPFPKG